MRKRILVTGGAGFVGKAVVTALAARKEFDVTVFDTVAPQSDVPFIKGDLRDSKNVLRSLQGIDIVVHLAADIGSLLYMEDHQAEIVSNNAAIDAVLYPAMVAAGVETVVYASSSMVFQHATQFPYKEKNLATIPPPTNVYGLSKLLGEYFCRSFQKQYGLQFVILRYHNIYGADEVKKGESSGHLHVIPALITKVLSGQYPIEILGNPNDTRPFTYIADAVSATVRLVEEAALQNPKVLNQDFNIGPREATKIIDLAKLIWEICGDDRPFRYTVKKVQADTATRREMDPSKMKRATAWEAKVGLGEGIRRLLV